MTGKAYIEAVTQADVLFDFPGTTPEQLVALGYRAGVGDSTAVLYESITSEKSNPKQILVVFHEKLAALARKFEKRAEELKI